MAVMDSLASDQEAGAYLLTKWLISQGRKRILRFWQTSVEGSETRLFWLAQRAFGYMRAMHEAGLDPLPAVEYYDLHYRAFGLTQRGFDYCSRVMAGYLVDHLHGPHQIDAIMTISDDAIGPLSAALKLNGKVPNKDVLVVGYDHMWDGLDDILKDGFPGPAATIDQRNQEIGGELVSLLQERINGGLFKEAERRVLAPSLIVRPASCVGISSVQPGSGPVDVRLGGH